MPNLFKNSSVGKILFFCLLLSACLSAYGYAHTTLKVGVYDNKPTIFVGDDGSAQGLFIDILEEIAIKENWRLEYVYGQFSDVFSQLKEGRIDILPAVAYSKQREEFIDYTNETILVNWGELYVSGDRKLSSLLELEGKKVAVVQGDIHSIALKELTGRFNISCRFLETDDYETVFEMLQANFVDVGVVNRLFGNLNKQKYSVEATPVIYNPIMMRFGATKGNYQDILTKIDSYILIFAADRQSIYYQSLNRWLTAGGKKVIPRWVTYLFIATVGVTLFFFWASLFFRRQVQKRTEELINANSLLKSQILERAKADEKLKISEERSRTWLEHSPVCTTIVDLDFNLQYMSYSGIKIHQIHDITQFYGRPYPFDFYPESFKILMAKNLSKVKAIGEVIEQEAPVVDIKGNELWLHSTLVPVNDEKGQIDYIIIVSLDITERKKAGAEKESLETQLRQAQKMEAIGVLAGGIAHDFNNILGAILGYAEMVQEDCPTGSTMRSDIDRVVEASHRAKELVKQILAFSRQTDTEDKPLQPGLIIKEAIKMLRSSLPTTIDIQQNIDPEAGLILADPTQIHQIITNLCTNAFHAMEETGGTLNISLKNREFTPADLVSEPHVQPGHFVEISVGDTGPGIAPEIMDKIFDPFFTTKEVGKGTGMGLAIIHGIAKKSGGFVSCKSSPVEGTTFYVYLPVHAVTSPPAAETTPIELIQTGIESILFVDDEEMLAEMGKTMLERLGYRVTVETNSIEALKIIQNQPDHFDLVITDQTMPGMTGSDLARRILQIRPGLPIILCTGFSNMISEDKAKIYGIKGFAMKPLAKKDFASLIRKVLDGEK